MYARTGISHMKPGKMDEAIGLYRDSVVPLLKKQKGFKRLYFLTDRKTGKYVVITVWETEADMTATESSGFLQEVIAKFGSLMAAPPTIERYEVGLQV